MIYTDSGSPEVAAEAKADHIAARGRGEFIRRVVEDVVCELDGRGYLRTSRQAMTVELRAALAAHLYPGKAVDI